MSVEAYRRPEVDSLSDRIQWAKHLATADMLPAQFRAQPGNLLLAQEYALSLGIPVGEVLAGSIHVIDGRPSLSSGLMQATVRRAGHRIRSGGDDRSAWCEIVRRDDPAFPFRVEFTIDDARRAGLLGKDNWRKYPRAMLLSRAVSECCKQACADVLAGIAYTPEELGDSVIDAEPWTGPQTAPRGPLTAVEPLPEQPAPAADDSPQTAPDDFAELGRQARIRVAVDEWTAELSAAIDAQALDTIRALGERALKSDWPGASGMGQQAREAWQSVRDTIANNAAPSTADIDPFMSEELSPGMSAKARAEKVRQATAFYFQTGCCAQCGNPGITCVCSERMRCMCWRAHSGNRDRPGVVDSLPFWHIGQSGQAM